MSYEYSDHLELGDHVKDPITGFEGIVTARTKFLHGCQRCSVTGRNLDKDGKEQILTFDEAQLLVIKHGEMAPKLTNSPKPPGGPARFTDGQSRPEGATRA